MTGELVGLSCEVNGAFFSIELGDENFLRHRRPEVVGGVDAFWQDDPRSLDLPVVYLGEQMPDAIEARLLLVHGGDDPPWRLRNVGAPEHDFFGFGVEFPTLAGFKIHGAEFPLFEGIVDPGAEAKLLFLVRNREPIFYHLDAGTDQHFFEFGHRAEELLVFVIAAKAHHPLDAGPVIPTAVEEHDLAGRRQVRDVALEIPLGLFAVGGRRQGGHAANPGIQVLGDPLDDAALAGGIPALADDDYSVPGLNHPVLQGYKLRLEAVEFLEIKVALGTLGRGAGSERGSVGGLGIPVGALHLHLFIEVVDDLMPDPLIEQVPL